MLYWMPKLKYTNKYLDRRTVEGLKLSAVELAVRALKMMARDPGTEVQCYKVCIDSLMHVPGNRS